MLFVFAGAVCAADIGDASNTEDSNLTADNVYTLSQEKLEVSNEDSISETNIVNSHDDNLNDYPEGAVLTRSNEPYYEDNGEQKLGLANLDSEVSVVGNDSVLTSGYDSSILTASKVSTSVSVSDTHYDKSATYFKVTLQDNDGKAVASQKITLKVNGKTYTGNTNSNGIANIKTAALAIGTYSVSISYAGSSNYSSSSLSKKVKVLSSISGKDVTKYYGTTTYYSATFWKDNAVLANTKVTFAIGSKKYTFTTNKKGVAVAKIGLNAGKYVITATNPYSNEVIKNNIVVKKDSTTLSGKAKVYILPYNYYTYSVVLTSKNGGPIKNCKVSFSYNNKTVSATTDSEGKASTVIPLLKEGTYKITYKYAGSGGYYASSSSGTIVIKSATTKFTASDLKMTYKDGSKFSVKFTTKDGKVLAGKTIKFILNGKNYKATTDSKGVAKLDVGDLKSGTYKVKYLYSTLGSSDYLYGYKNIVVNKVTLKLTAYNLQKNYNDNVQYKATVKDSSGKVMKNIKVKFTVNGKDYTAKTDSNGVAKVTLNLPIGYYPVKSTVSQSNYKSNTVSKKILINGSKFSYSESYVSVGTAVSYSVKLIDGMDKAIKGASVKFTFNSKTYTAKTNSNGVAKVSLGNLKSGNYAIKFTYDSAKGSSKIHVVDKVSISDIIKASKNVKSYIEKNSKLPATVKIGSITYSTADYLYLASKAIVNLNSGKKDSISIKNIKNPSSPGAASNKGNLYNYLDVAKSIIKTAESKGQMPNSVSSSVGTIGYNGIVYAFARVVAFYDNNDNLMPAYVAIKTLSSSSSTSSLNSKNTITNLAAYLAASTNCQVNNSQIKQLVTKLTKGLDTDKEKATAIYNYVRDTISYSFYYDTKYGAVGTLNSKKGNCVDHSHLLVAMYRTAGLAARYVHGTCTFTSGTYGHVWTQVLIGDTWVVSDATSARNSFGNVVNWNSNSYTLKGYYASIGF